MMNAYEEEFGLAGPALVTCFGEHELHGVMQSGKIASLRKYLQRHPDNADRGVEIGFETVTLLCAAAWCDNLPAAKLLVKHGAQVNHRSFGLNAYGRKYSITPLHVAVRYDHFGMTKFLINQGADVNAVDFPTGYTPIHLAMVMNKDKIAPYLIRYAGADPNIPGNEDFCNYPLHKATLHNNYRMMLLLLLGGTKCDPNVADDNDGMTALHISVMDQSLDAVRMLVHNGANPNLRLKSGHTPLDLACFPAADPEIVKFLKSAGGENNVKEDYSQFIFLVHELDQLKTALDLGSNINCRLFGGETMLQHAIEQKEFEIARHLLERGANVNISDHSGVTPLHCAARLNDVRWIELLLEYGANLFAKDSVGRTPLHAAAERGAVESLSLLVALSPQVLSVYTPRGTPLICAVNSGSAATVQVLIDAHVNVNAPILYREYSGYTALAAACAHNSPKLIKMLLNNGAIVNHPLYRNGQLILPIYLLPNQYSSFLESLTIIMEAGAYFDMDIFEPQMRGGPKDDEVITLDQLIERSVHSKELTIYRNTVRLFQAIKKKNLALVQKLVSHGALVNCCSITMDTPLILASYLGALNIVEFLLNAGAVMYMPSVTRSSPLHYAAKYDRRTVAVRLLKSGARITYLCKGVTALEEAMMANKFEMTNLLVFVGRYLLEKKIRYVIPVKDYKSDPVVIRILDSMADRRPDEQLLTSLFALP